MKQGKLPTDVLARLLARLPSRDPRVLVGPRVGEDAAALDLGDRVLVMAMDPITFATDLIGWYAVQVNANDVAVMGAEPRWFLGALLLPQGFPEDDVAPIFDQLAEACEKLGVDEIGGHTEVTSGVSRPVLVGCMLGEAPPGRAVTTAGAEPGDVVVLYGAAGVEGTAILAREAGEVLAERGLDAELAACAREFLFDPGISVVRPALAAAAYGVTAMHDPTEGGIATGLAELALASEVGLEIDAGEIRVLPVTRSICDRLGLDPLGLIASGSLLATVRPEAAEGLLRAASDMKPGASVIGRVLGKAEGATLLVGRKRCPLPHFARDEVARFFEEQGQADA
jgi:hydrogenase maturation factor